MTSSTLARARQILTNCRRAPLICKLTLTCTVRRCKLVLHTYLRSARAPLPKLLEPRARDGCRYPVNAPPRATAQARPSPRARASFQPPKDCIYIFSSAPARRDGSSGSDPVENQNK
eukprot:3716525-Pleurochrysis_carterae.AAC.3